MKKPREDLYCGREQRSDVWRKKENETELNSSMFYVQSQEENLVAVAVVLISMRARGSLNLLKQQVQRQRTWNAGENRLMKQVAFSRQILFGIHSEIDKIRTDCVVVQNS
jgi:hypothetical protein